MTRLVEPLTAEERVAMIAAARSYLGVPFRHRGRTRNGIDCVGLGKLALGDVGREVVDRKGYGRDPVRDGLRDVLVDHFGPPVWTRARPLSELEPGLFLLIRWHRQGTTDLFNHVAISTDYPLGGLAMIHALVANRKVVEHRMADPWPRRIVEAYRP